MYVCLMVNWENHCFFIFLFFFGGSALEVLSVGFSLFSDLDTGDLEPSSSVLPVEFSSVYFSFLVERSCCHNSSSSLKKKKRVRYENDKHEMHFATSKPLKCLD